VARAAVRHDAAVMQTAVSIALACAGKAVEGNPEGACSREWADQSNLSSTQLNAGACRFLFLCQRGDRMAWPYH